MNPSEFDPVLIHLAGADPVDAETLVTAGELDSAWKRLHFSVITDPGTPLGPETDPSWNSGSKNAQTDRGGRSVTLAPETRRGRSRVGGNSFRRPVGVLAGVLVAAAAATVVLLLSGGSGLSIVAKAYAATNPRGVIVHYVETSQYRLPDDKLEPPQTTFVWIYGSERRVLFTFKAAPGKSQDIVSRPGTISNLANGALVVAPERLSVNPCSAAEALETCTTPNGGTPISALRGLLRTHQIHSAGTTTYKGQSVDVLAGSAHNIGTLTVRALIDPKSFTPVKITMAQTYPQGKGKKPYIESFVITGYQGLAPTAQNLKLLKLPPHPNTRTIRFRACPTAKLPGKLCH